MVRRLLLGADGVALRAGVMSVTWMAVFAGLIAIEKTIPWRRDATYGTTVVLVVVGVIMLPPRPRSNVACRI